MGDQARRQGAWASGLLRLAAVAAVPGLLFTAHATFFSSWEIDDAGISYAYARNLAAGEGLVAQAGLEPVEGFTNLLWVVLLAVLLPFFESPGSAARVLSYALVLGSFLTLALGTRSWFPHHWHLVAGVGLSVSALVTGFPAWTLSGLENGLYVCLVTALLVAATLAPDTPAAGVGASAVWILLIATRPDAAPLVVVPAAAWAGRRHTRSVMPFALTAATGLFALTAFRMLYFGDAFPNTYYAKGAPGWELLAGVSWSAPTGLLFGLVGALVLLGTVRLTWSLAIRTPWLEGRSEQQVGFLTLWLTLLVSYLTFETLPTDWMPEGRFATTLFLLGPTALLGLVRRRRLLLTATSATLLLLAVGYSSRHTPAFARSPPAPFASVVELSNRLAAVGEALGTGNATTVLLPDIGGALWLDRFVVLDLGGLIDRRIARTLRAAHDREEFLDYVFETRRPDLVWAHGYWREVADLESDPRFARDYQLLFKDDLHTLHVRAAAARRIGPGRLLAAFSPAGWEPEHEPSTRPEGLE